MQCCFVYTSARCVYNGARKMWLKLGRGRVRGRRVRKMLMSIMIGWRMLRGWHLCGLWQRRLVRRRMAGVVMVRIGTAVHVGRCEELATIELLRRVVAVVNQAHSNMCFEHPTVAPDDGHPCQLLMHVMGSECSRTFECLWNYFTEELTQVPLPAEPIGRTLKHIIDHVEQCQGLANISVADGGLKNVLPNSHAASSIRGAVKHGVRTGFH